MQDLMPRPQPRFIRSEEFVRMLRILRASAPELIALELIIAFESQSPVAYSLAFVGGSLYIIGSDAFFATLSEENKNTLLRKIFLAVDNSIHGTWMSLKLIASVVVVVIDIVSHSIDRIEVPDWVIIPIAVPAAAIGVSYAVTQALDIHNKPTQILSSILLAAQLSRLLNVPLDIVAETGVDVHYLYHTGTIILSASVAAALKCFENGRPGVVSAQSFIQYLSWTTYPVTVTLDNILLKPFVWPVPTYVSQGVALAASAVACGVIGKKYYDARKIASQADEESQSEEMSGSETKEDTTPLFPKKTTVGCWGRLKARFWSAPSENNSTRPSAQTGLSAETDRTSGSPSLNSEVLSYQSGNTKHPSLQKK